MQIIKFFNNTSIFANPKIDNLCNVYVKIASHSVSEGAMEGIRGGHFEHGFFVGMASAAGGAALDGGMCDRLSAAERIAVIFHTDNLSRGKSSQEILDNRQQSVKPLVDAFFAWVKDILDNKVISSTDLKKALTYSLNQEKYLRVFLGSAIIPMDNNDVERSIKKFCVGKHSWHIIDSKKGAKASAILYSIAETAKANGLNPFEYFKFLMEQLKEYPRNDVPEEELKKLMPWSETLPDCCKQLKKQS